MELTLHLFSVYRVVKLSSPNLNYFIITGAALLYVSIYLYIIPINTKCTANIICNVSLIVGLNFITRINNYYSNISSFDYGLFPSVTHCVLLLFSLKHGEFIISSITLLQRKK